MKLINPICALALVVLGASFVLAQSATEDKWLRVQTDNGEFSVEVPDDYAYFFDKDGYSIPVDSSDYSLQDVSILNAYRDGTLISFEVYRTRPVALDSLISTSVRGNFPVRKSKLNGLSVKEIVKSEDKYHFVSYFFKSKDHVYVISSASRTGETPAMMRFFQSLRFAPDSTSPASDAATFSTLRVTRVTIQDAAANPSVKGKTPAPAADETEPVIVSMVRPSYVPVARQKNVQGAVRLRMELAPNGSIPNITIVKGLPEGMSRQAVFAAFRLKFLPAEKAGIPISKTKTLEYSFSIY